MTFQATTRVSILSDKTTEDEYGDEVDSDDVVAYNIRAHIWEERRTVYDPQQGRRLTVRSYLALIPHDQEIDFGYRIKDEESEQIYLVEHVHRPKSFVGPVPTRVEMQTSE